MNSCIVSARHMPTNEGRHRYCYTYGYFPDQSSAPLQPDMSLPCSCIALCADRCDGECGCLACSLQFVIWADEAAYSGPNAPVSTRKEQVKIYRGRPKRHPTAYDHERQ
jgi:hypothetical protein